MTIARPLSLFILSVVILSVSGCAKLPDVSEVIDEAPAGGEPRRIESSEGVLSAVKSKAIMDRLKGSVDPTDILGRHSVVVESVTDSPLTKGNKVTLLADGQVAYAAMFKAMREARNTLNIESYIIEDDKTGRAFAELMLRKQAEGVQVHLIYDSVGSMSTPPSFFKVLRDGGVQVVAFNPVNPLKARQDWGLTHRDHRKILIADGKIAIIGGINISNVYSSNPLKRKKDEDTPIHWRDTDVQIEGPAVAEFQKLFHDTWLKQKGPKLSGEGHFPDLKDKGKALVRVVGSLPGEANRIPFVMYVSAITFAERSIHMTNSYFIPDDQVVEALARAAKSGVDVKIILPGITDSQSALFAQRYHYADLLKSGVKIYERDTSLLHAKTAVVDEVWSTVGSTNMDFLSLLNNDEVNAVILDHEFAVEMEKLFVMDIEGSRQILWDDWRKRSILTRVREWLMHRFVRLL